jgi:MFS transporter, PPP family, 3-phenylpropionic acid transporter
MKVMGASESLIGISSTMAAASEIPIMLFSAILLRKAGALRLLAIAFFIYGVRAFLYSIMPAPEWVLFINLLNGASFGIFWIGAVTYANDLAPANLKTTAQSMMFSTINLAFVVGAVSSGWLFDQVGPAGLFQVLTVCCLLALLLFVTGHLFLKRRRPAAAA